MLLQVAVFIHLMVDEFLSLIAAFLLLLLFLFIDFRQDTQINDLVNRSIVAHFRRVSL